MKKMIMLFAIVAMAFTTVGCDQQPQKNYKKVERTAKGDTPFYANITVGDASQIDSLSYCYGLMNSFGVSKQLPGVKFDWELVYEGCEDAFYCDCKNNKQIQEAGNDWNEFLYNDYYARLSEKQQAANSDPENPVDPDSIDIFKDDAERQSYSYNFGLMVGAMTAQNRIPIQIHWLKEGMKEGIKENMDLKATEAQGFMNTYFMEVLPEINLKKSQEWFADVEATVEGVQKSESGLLYLIENPGDENRATEADLLKINFEWSFADGTVFETTSGREPIKTNLAGLFQGWQEAVSLVGKGGKITAWIPAELAFGPQGNRFALPNDAIKIQMELLDFYLNTPEANLERSQEWLANIEASVEGVQKTESGLLYLIEREGDVNNKPSATDKVKAHYEGTTFDGTKFDSSYDRGEPSEFPLSQVIKGWTEGLQLIGKGGKIILWIPAELAYGASSPSPNIGANEALKFVVELEDVIKPEAAEQAAAPATK